MTLYSQEEFEGAAQAISILHEETVSSSFARRAENAAADLCSGAGPELLHIPTELHQLIDQALEIGYAAALKDVRAGKFDGDIPQWRPELVEGSA
ncbi:hypothetical protein [Streptomyces sp. BH055]|uniref:hypothetical protein n=1 Tax=unclassified Streptomyces TaxID=2593676 RepID=UPI003BB797AA